MTTLMINTEQTLFADSWLTLERTTDGKRLPSGRELKIRPVNDLYIEWGGEKYPVLNYGMCGNIYDTIIGQLPTAKGDLLRFLRENIYHDVGRIAITFVLQCKGVPIDKEGNSFIFYIDHNGDDGWCLHRVPMIRGDNLVFGSGQSKMETLGGLFPEVSMVKVMALMLTNNLSKGSGGDIKFVTAQDHETVGIIPIREGSLDKSIVNEFKESFLSRFK